jgi:precorrin-6B methylase 1
MKPDEDIPTRIKVLSKLIDEDLHKYGWTREESDMTESSLSGQPSFNDWLFTDRLSKKKRVVQLIHEIERLQVLMSRYSFDSNDWSTYVTLSQKIQALNKIECMTQR